MEFTTATNTNVVTTAEDVVKTPEPDTETPTRNQPTPFTNGILKRHAPLHLHHPVVVTYKECLKNHAAALGGHAVDGCGEFMPSPSSNPTDPTSLKCAACGCHRNFHRREPDVTAAHPPAIEYHPHHRHLPPPPRGHNDDDHNPTSPNDSPSPPPISSTYPHMLLALSGHQQGHQPHPHHASAAAAAYGVGHIPPAARSNGSTRKRFRTKFTQDQKEKMLEFAEKVGWKMQKKDEDIINEFLNGIGVDKGVFKVWMHNNKNACSGKKDQQLQISTTSPNAKTCNNFALSSPFVTAPTAGTVNSLLPGLVNTATASMGDNNDNHGSNGLNIYGQEMRSIHIQNLSHEHHQVPGNGPADQDISSGTSGTGHGAGTNGS